MSARRVGAVATAAVTAVTLLVPATAVAATSATAPPRSARVAVPLAAQEIAWPVVRRGSTGEPVRSLQYLLRARGSALAVDGAFGARTDRAVRAFQRSHGLAVDGVVGRSTWTALLITVRRGSRGDAVRAVQDQFQFRNLSGDPSKGPAVDGVFGPDTQGRVRAFQSAVGLVADGVVGPRTWNQLIGGALSG